MWTCPKCNRDFKNSNQEHYCGSAPSTIDEYIEQAPAEHRDVLQCVRETILKAAPNAQEKIAWRMPTFWQDGNLIHFAAFKNHLGLYPGEEGVSVFEEHLRADGYKFNKGTIQLPWNKPMPYELIEEITRFRVNKATKKTTMAIGYIALLRGVNVGGNNKISMPELKARFEEQGFTNVVTYINSGNILFTCDLDKTTVQKHCEELIETSFGLKITVCIIKADELLNALKNAPDWWNVDRDSKHNAIFVIPPMTSEQICAEVGETKPEYEKVTYHGNVIFWSAPLSTFSHTRWSKITQSKAAYEHITIRNANTTLKLAELVTIK